MIRVIVSINGRYLFNWPSSITVPRTLLSSLLSGSVGEGKVTFTGSWVLSTWPRPAMVEVRLESAHAAHATMQRHSVTSKLSLMTAFTARCYAKRAYLTISGPSVRLSDRPSDRLSVTLRYADHTDWNTSKTISRLISFQFWLGLAPTQATWSKSNTLKIWVK